MCCSRIYNRRGFTLTEVLVATGLTALLGVAAMHFYSSMNQQVVSQQEISEMQQINRACLDEIAASLRSAGYLLSSHPAYEIAGDSLYVYYRGVNPVDTVLYFLEEFTDAEYDSMMVGRPAEVYVYKLMKQVNADAPVVFADYITRVLYTPIGTRTIAVTLEVQTSKADATFPENSGFRTFINTERVVLRNLS